MLKPKVLKCDKGIYDKSANPGSHLLTDRHGVSNICAHSFGMSILAGRGPSDHYCRAHADDPQGRQTRIASD